MYAQGERKIWLESQPNIVSHPPPPSPRRRRHFL